MIDNIIAGVTVAPEETRRFPWGRAAVAAAAVAAVGLAVPFLIPQSNTAGPGSPTPTPSITGSPSLAPSPDPTTSTPPGPTVSESPTQKPSVSPSSTQVSALPRPTAAVSTTLALGEVAELSHFQVVVSKKEFNHTGTATGWLVRVCYVAPHDGANPDGTTRTSLDPWYVTTWDGETQWESDAKQVRVKEFPQTVEFGPEYTQKALKVGECNEGWITVAHGNPDAAWGALVYKPADFGDVVEWHS